MKRLILIVLCVYNLNVFSQTSKSISTTFALHFVEEGIMVLNNESDKNIFYNTDLVNIEVDTLNNYNAEILFFKFKLGKNKVQSQDKNTEITFNSSSCNDYILGFNINNQTSYRLKGFNGNDLLFLLRDINNLSSYKSSSKKLLLSLNDLNIGLDFSAIYKALLNLNFEAECLKACSDGKPAHGSIKK